MVLAYEEGFFYFKVIFVHCFVTWRPLDYFGNILEVVSTVRRAQNAFKVKELIVVQL